MKAKYLFLLILLSSGLIVSAQPKDKKMVFILLIDNEIPVTNIYDGVFIVRDSSDIIKDCIAFKYQVGTLELSPVNYDKLLFKYFANKITIDFKYLRFHDHYSEVHEYKKTIPGGWLNEMYMIFKVYNYFNPESRRKYALVKNGYGIEIRVPGAGTVIAIRK